MAVAETGRQKAATLLMNLDSSTASELLNGFSAEEIQDLAMEMAQIEMASRRDRKKEAKVVREFCSSLQKSGTQGMSLKGFLKDTLGKILDKEKAGKIQANVKKVLEKSDPFESIHSAEVDELTLALEKETPSIIASVLLELNSKKAREVLLLLDKEVCCKVVWHMTRPAPLTSRMKCGIASIIGKRLQSFEGETISEKPEETLRNLAIVLSDMERNLRDQALDEIKGHDEQAAVMVRNLMVTWEDITSIADRSLQEALRTVESKTLALALYQADEEIAQRIRSNISERAIAAIDEEIMLMQEPLEEEVFNAREDVVGPLRKANEDGSLRRVKQG